MARAAGSRAASAKPVDAKDSKDAKVNGTGTSQPSTAPQPTLKRAPAAPRGAKKADDAPATNGIAEESEELDEVEEQPKKLAARGGRAKKADAPAPAAPAKANKRKKAEESEAESEEEPAPAVKKPKVEQPKAAPKAAKAAKVAQEPAKPLPKGPRRTKKGKTEINAIRYTEPLKVFVFGEGSSGELGLGATKKAIDVKRPRYNEPLSNLNVVKVAAGGMHVVALTKDNKILTWGVNDNGALGRDTSNADVKMRDLDADDSDSDSEDESGGLNDLESTPTAVSDEYFPEDTVFVDIAAGDSCSFALTTEGAIYGWGTFRKNEGILGFERGNHTAKFPVYIDSMKKVTQIACGTNHVYALDKDQRVYAWGNGQQNQLGRRVTERSLAEALQPNRIGFHDPTAKRHSQKIVSIASGDYHGLAIAEDGHIWAWGANNYCETGFPDNAGAEDASLLTPRIIHSLEGKNVASLAGGAHHNIAITKDGQVLVWGRCDGSQTGIPADVLAAEEDSEKVLKNNGKPKILVQPTPIPNLKNIVAGACGPDHTIVVDKNGKAYAWGFSANYQTGLGTDDDVDVPTMIDNTATREEKLMWAGCGGQYSILASKK
ncbi:RCC1/BLIP-II [Plenodomus tracheiphilus IPT5]|uniref:RCC1/BLIP-II n=1 Tax=Plenodomus tracheiphilus IPT5 TaxID=1408161 RepID=A0A6A7BCB2_9PLEO|nr:RCC1/BLIP-II [Plenodomus tracheiphilus IPT5]